MADTYEGSAWFWKIFGGAVIGLISLLTITLLNVINNSNERARTDLSNVIQEMRMDVRNIRTDLDDQKQKLMKIETQTPNEKLSVLEKQLGEIDKAVKDRSEKIASMEAALTALKEKVGEGNSGNKELIERIVSLEMEIKAIKEKSQQVQVEAEAKKTSLREGMN